jgi:hypothetical protein
MPDMTALMDAAQAGVGLWIGLAGGFSAGMLLALRRDERLRQRLDEELAHNADLRSSLLQHRNIIRAHSLVLTLPPIPRAPGAGRHWPARALTALGRAIAGTDQRVY